MLAALQFVGCAVVDSLALAGWAYLLYAVVIKRGN